MILEESHSVTKILLEQPRYIGYDNVNKACTADKHFVEKTYLHKENIKSSLKSRR